MIEATPSPVLDPSTMRDRTQRCVAVVMLGFVAATSYHYWLTAYEGMDYPAGTYLYRTEDTMGVPWEGASRRHCFGDFLGPWLVAQKPSPYVQMPYGKGSNYLPFAHVLMLPFSAVPYQFLLPSYLASCAGLVFFFFYRVLEPLPRADRIVAGIALGLMSYPTHILLDRGNLESLVFAFLVGFFLAYQANRPMLAALSLAAAIAIKGYPALCGLLFLNRGQLKELLACGAMAVVFVFSSAAVFDGGALTTLQDCFAGIAYYVQIKTGGDAVAGGSSLRGLLETLAYLLRGVPELWLMPAWLSDNFRIVQLAIGVGLVAMLLLWRFRVWEVFACCCFAMMSLLSVAPDYRLIHWFIPLAAFLVEPMPIPRSTTYALLFGLLLIPKGIILKDEAKWSVLINPMLMLVIVGLIAIDAGRRPRDGIRPYEILHRRIQRLCGGGSPQSLVATD